MFDKFLTKICQLSGKGRLFSRFHRQTLAGHVCQDFDKNLSKSWQLVPARASIFSALTSESRIGMDLIAHESPCQGQATSQLSAAAELQLFGQNGH